MNYSFDASNFEMIDDSFSNVVRVGTIEEVVKPIVRPRAFSPVVFKPKVVIPRVNPYLTNTLVKPIAVKPVVLKPKPMGALTWVVEGKPQVVPQLGGVPQTTVAVPSGSGTSVGTGTSDSNDSTEEPKQEEAQKTASTDSDKKLLGMKPVVAYSVIGATVLALGAVGYFLWKKNK